MPLSWVLVDCNTAKEAEKIGMAALKARHAVCFDIIPRQTRYFWPPESGKIICGNGALLILKTTPGHIKALRTIILRLHSDKLPFIGVLKVGGVSSSFMGWLKGELR